MIEETLKKTLDDAVLSDGIKTYHQRLTESQEKNRPSEYLIYTVESMTSQIYGDDAYQGGNEYVQLFYFHRFGLQGKAVREKAMKIIKVMREAGFTCSSGYYDLGDIDQIGYDVTCFDFYLFGLEDEA